MRYRFSKMHGLGNDFVVFDAIGQNIELDIGQIHLLADRHFGIGCDQILLVERPRDTRTEFYYRIYNADGSEVEQCGNGARCFARFVLDQGLTDNQVIDVGTANGPIRLFAEDNGEVRVNMGAPRLQPGQIPFNATHQAVRYPLQVDKQLLHISAISMGNPHAVLQVDDVATAPVQLLGPLIEHHVDFPQRVNAGFMAIKSRSAIDLRVYERGAGETLACGTGACAAVVAGHLQGLLDERVEVQLPGGHLMISWTGDNQPVWMTGPATTVFEGSIEL